MYFWRVCVPMLLSFLFTFLVPFLSKHTPGVHSSAFRGKPAMLVTLVILGFSNAALCACFWLRAGCRVTSCG
jgi:hypothetical protein